VGLFTEGKKREQTTKGGNCNAVQLEGRSTLHPSFWEFIRCPECISLQIQHSCNLLWIQRPRFPLKLDILEINGHLPVFWWYFYHACAETAVSELLVKNLASTLDSGNCNALQLKDSNNTALRQRFEASSLNRALR